MNSKLVKLSNDINVITAEISEIAWRKNIKLLGRYSGEISMKAAEEYGVDRRNYKLPVRRERTRKETWQTDREAKSRNEERRKAYREFTRVQVIHFIILMGANTALFFCSLQKW